MSRWSDWLEWCLSGSKEGERELSGRKAKILKDVCGEVVEIGPGAGENFSCYRKGVSWTGVEPNRSHHPDLYREAKKAGLKRISLRAARGEELPFRDSSADVVVGTYVLCSVESPFRVLSEVLRVLKPGGKFIFFEHVVAPRGTKQWWIQKATKPFWTFIGSGCHPDLDTASVIREAKFRELHLESFTVDRPIDGPHIAGFAVK